MESHKSFHVWLLRHTVLGRRGSQLRVVSQGDPRVGGGGGGGGGAAGASWRGGGG